MPLKYSILLLPLLCLILISCDTQEVKKYKVNSPIGRIEVYFSLTENGSPYYTVIRDKNIVIDTSFLGFKLDDSNFSENFRILKTSSETVDETWTQVWGEQKNITNKYNELKAFLEDDNGRLLNIIFRVFDDGISFRYEFPKQENLIDFTIQDELTEFNLTEDHTVWWIPADYHSYEFLYTQSKMSDIDASKYGYTVEQRDRYIDNVNAVNTPVTLKTDQGLYISLHEANLTDYAGMTLAVKANNTFKAELVPWADGSKVKAKAPSFTPWRTITIGDKPTELLDSRMILNLNEPNKIADVSWIEPMTYTGIWWQMHIGKNTWGTKVVPGSIDQDFSGGTANHGASTENVKELIDFTSESGIKGLLIEGWNTGWEYWGVDTLGFFDFQTPASDMDMEEVTRYAKSKNVKLIGHHETAGDPINYEKHMEKAFKYYHDLGIGAVKTGYAGPINPEGEFHHGQFMVRHYRKVVEMAAKYQIMIDAHEPIKDTGIRRTYPNMMTREGVRGMEYNAWSEPSPPNHTTILPFTRGLSGPMDYTPGIFDVLIDKYRPNNRVNSTIINQMALMVVLYSPVQMAADLQENYEKYPDLFEFIKTVPSDWEQTVNINGEIGEFVTVARKNGENWFIGGITNADSRKMDVTLDFLNEGQIYAATIYADGLDADWNSNPMDYKIETKSVTKGDVLPLSLASGGGVAITLINEGTIKEKQD